MSRVSDYWQMGDGYAEICRGSPLSEHLPPGFLTDVCSEQREGASARTGLEKMNNVYLRA